MLDRAVTLAYYSYMNTTHTYSVNGKGFNGFLEAVAYAKLLGADVIQNDNGFRRWTPAPAAKARKVRHVLVNADGSHTEFSKVRR